MRRSAGNLHSIKYRDTSIPNAKGASGNATIEPRALLGRDGATDLEVTTGSFESGPADTIERLVGDDATGITCFSGWHQTKNRHLYGCS